MFKILFTLIFSIGFSQQFGWVDNGEALRQGVHIEWQKTGDIGNNGEMIFAWSDTRTSDREVYAQKFDSSGNKLWGDDGVIVVEYEGRQEDPILIHDGNGGAYVIWRDYRVEPDPVGDVYAQHINSDGTLSYPTDGFALSNEPGYQVSLNMCSDGQGGAYAIWMDTSGKTYASHLTPDSSQIPNPGTGTVIMDHDWTYASISLETAGGGDAMMVWFDERIVDGQPVQDIYSQRIGLDSNGDIITKWSAPQEGGIPICTAEGKQEGAKVTYYNEDWNVVVWEDSRHNDYLASNGAPSSIDIYAQFIDADGNKADAYYENGNPLVSNLCYDPTSCTPSFPLSDQTNPRVKAADGAAFVIWIDKRNNNDDIYMQMITPDNPAVLSGSSNYPFDGVVVTDAASTQGSARLSTDGFGGAYIVWDDLQEAHYNLYIQHYDSNGAALFQVGGLALSDADNNQLAPLVRPDQNGGAFAVWEDRKDGSISIYAQHIDGNTGPTLQEDGVSMYYGIDGNAFLYNDQDLYKSKSKSLYLNNQNLVYWEDRRGGNIYVNETPFTTYYTFGSFVDASGPSDAIQLSSYYDQKFPSINQSGDGYLLSFVGGDIGTGDDMIKYQMIDQNLNPLGSSSEGVFIDDELFAPQGSNRTYGVAQLSSGLNMIAYSKSSQSSNYQSEIFSAFTDPAYPDGTGQDPTLVYSKSADFSSLSVKDVYSDSENCQLSDGGDCILIIFEEQDISGNISLKVKAEANTPIDLSNDGQNQQFRDAVQTGDGVFVVWEENKNGNVDIFGQHIGFDGVLLGPSSGISICDDTAEQKNPSIDYSSNLNEIMVCWDDRRNSDRDIYCASVSLTSFIVNEIPITANKIEAQVGPYVKATLTDSYLVAWEESVLYDSGDVFTGDPVYYYDIAMQEIRAGQEVYAQDVVVCDAFHDQRNPRIDMLSDSGDVSYLIYWEDMRSSGKEDLTNLFAQQLRINDCNGTLGGDALFPEGACNCNGDVVDQCGVCGGDDSSCTDCAGTPNGGAVDLGCGCGEPAAENGYDCDGNFLDIAEQLPTEYRLYNNYPNPFNPVTNIKFDIPDFGYVKVLVYNLNGQIVRTLQEGNLIPGKYSMYWDGLDDYGQALSSGIYFCYIEANGFSQKNKMVLAK